MTVYADSKNSATVIDRRTLERRPNDGLRSLFDDTPARTASAWKWTA